MRRDFPWLTASIILVVLGLALMVDAERTFAQVSEREIDLLRREVDRLQDQVRSLEGHLRSEQESAAGIRLSGFQRLAALEREVELNRKLSYGNATVGLGNFLAILLSLRKIAKVDRTVNGRG